MSLRYLSVCSGIEAATCAWHPLGWAPEAFAEIAPFPSAVLAHHYPAVPNLRDFTTITEERLRDLGPVRLLVGGTPCQSFSVAGLRKGLADPRGNLALAFLRLAHLARPRWVVWENVPGVLSSSGGRDFGAFLGALGQLGYGFAYRVLDAQFFGVPQRRRRVFVVGHFGDWRAAAAVLFERESLSGNPPPRRQAWARVAGTLEARAGTGGWDPGAHRAASGHLVAARAEAFGGGNCSGPIEVAAALCAHGLRQDFEVETFIAHTLRADGFDASEDGTGRGTPLVPVAFDWQSGGDVRHNVSEHHTSAPQACQTPAVLAHAPAVAIQERADSEGPGGPGGKGWTEELAYTMEARHRPQRVASNHAVRRITPREAERLQGFPDDYTLIPWRGKPAAECPDGPRYHALGNSMAVPCMAWVGRRIQQVEEITSRTPVAA